MTGDPAIAWRFNGADCLVCLWKTVGSACVNQACVQAVSTFLRVRWLAAGVVKISRFRMAVTDSWNRRSNVNALISWKDKKNANLSQFSHTCLIDVRVVVTAVLLTSVMGLAESHLWCRINKRSPNCRPWLRNYSHIDLVGLLWWDGVKKQPKQTKQLTEVRISAMLVIPFRTHRCMVWDWSGPRAHPALHRFKNLYTVGPAYDSQRFSHCPYWLHVSLSWQR